MVWLKIRENDIFGKTDVFGDIVVVWLKIRENDINIRNCNC